MRTKKADEKVDPDAQTYVMVRMDGRLKNELAKHCRAQDVSMNAWLIEIIKYGIRHQKGVPQPPPAVAPLPTAAEVVRAWAQGEKVLTPCGKRGECYGTNNDPDMHDGMGFCRECGIRVV